MHRRAEAGDPNLPTLATDMSAAGGATRAQIRALAAIFLLAIGAIIVGARLADLALLLVAPVLLLSISLHLNTVLSRPAVCPRMLLPAAALPPYTVIVPLYRETAVLPALIDALSALLYPVDRLEILLVIEWDDLAMIAALRQRTLDRRFRVVIAPPGEPRTKPRALNIALAIARGTYVVVYDAEDVPEPIQLWFAASVFGQSGPEVGCLQAHLAIDNGSDGLLTRLFALEYAGLFDVVKPGLAAMGLPVPLGGTSNHFRRSDLIRIGGWDAWNVTEDADLGLRLARCGLIVVDLPSSTYEEGPNTLRAWMLQRRRWMKGWMQTVITHTRNPARLLADLGPIRTLAAAAIFAGTLLAAFTCPWLTAWLLARLWLHGIAPDGAIMSVWRDALAVGIGNAGLAAVLVPMLIGAARRGMARHHLTLALLPVYLTLLSVATWWALIDLVRAPYRWHKTEHGLAGATRSRAACAQRAAGAFRHGR